MSDDISIETIEFETPFLGKKRKYTFNLMDAETGLDLFHEHLSILMMNAHGFVGLIPKLKDAWEKIKEKFHDDHDDEDEEKDLSILVLFNDLVELIPLLPTYITINRIKYLSKLMLNGMIVKIEDEVYGVGESGIGEYARGKPLEVYYALACALYVNYKTQIDPLLEALEQGKDSSPT